MAVRADIKNKYTGWIEINGKKHRFEVEGTSVAEIKRIIREKQPNAKVSVKRKKKR